ncbi:threonine ammonia-lyase IlvA [Limosilactobacillus fermentum]
MTNQLTVERIEAARKALRGTVKKTALQYDPYLSERYHANIYLKREDLQDVRSFKIRGAFFSIHQLTPEQRQRGVVCASAGNHAQGVAWTAAKLKIPATIFMPVTTPQQKVNQVRHFGGDFATIKLTGDTFDQSSTAAQAFCKEERQTFMAPFDNLDTMAGQGTIAAEILEDQPEVDYLVATIGGGGLLAGMSTYAKAKRADMTIVGVEPDGAASMAAAKRAGHPVTLDHVDTFVDGAAVQRVGDLTFETVMENVDQLLDVSNGADCQAILDLYNREAIVAEPAGALPVAGLEQLRDQITGKTVVCVISGGNNDVQRIQEIEERALLYRGDLHYYLVNFPQRAGALRQFVNNVLGPQDDIYKFEYTKKNSRGYGPVLVGIRLADRYSLGGLSQRLTNFDKNHIDLNDNPMLYAMFV